MSDQTSRLAVIIDSSCAQKNAESLTSALINMGKAGVKATDSTENLSGVTKDYNSWLKQGPKLHEQEVKARQQATKATNDEAKALGALLDKINPITAALNRLDDQQDALSKFKSKGMLDEETFTEYSAKIDQAREKLTGFSEALTKTGNSSRHAAHGISMIPSQLSWMVTSIASGQSPIMALVQQGSMLSGMMGGIGPAIRGVGAYLAELISPLTVAGTAVGVYGAALYAAEKQASALNIAVNGLTNISGMNMAQITALIQGTTALGVSYGDAVNSVESLSQSLSTNADLYPQIIKASREYSEASGQDLATVISLFTQLSDSSGKAIDTLDDKLGFLTAAQRKQADEALRSGNITDAQRIAFESLSSRLEILTKQLNLGATGWDKFWHSVDRGASNTWEGFKEVVGGNYFDNRDVERYQQRTAQRSTSMSAGTWTGSDEQHYQMLNDTPVIRAYVKATSDLDAATKEAAGNAYLKSLNKDLNANADTVTKAKTALVALDDQYKAQPADIQKQGHSDYLARRVELQKNLSDAEAAAARKNKTSTGINSDDAASRILSQLNQQHVALVAQLDTTQKLGTAQQALLKWQTKLAEIQKKANPTADDKSLLAHQKQITAAYQRNANDEQAQQAKVEARKIADYQNQLSQQLQTARNANSASQQGLGMGSLQAGRYKYLQQLQAQQDTDSNALLNKRDSGDITDSTYQAELTSLKSYYQQRAQIAKEGYAQEDTARQDWQKGLTNGLHNSIDAANDMYSQMSTLAQTAFTGMADSLANFVVTGKANFKDFTTTILTDLAKIEMERALAGIATSIFSFSGASANAGTAISGAASSTGALGLSTSYTGYDSGGFTGVGGKYDPAGIVHKGEFVFTQEATNRIGKDNLARLMKGYSSGGYVGSPTRTSALNANQSSGSNISLGGIVVNVNSQGQASSDSSTGGQGIAKQIQAAVVNTINEQANKQGTPLWRAIKGR